MYARTTTVRGDPGAVDEGIEYVRDAVWPMLQHMSGCVGMSMLADREAGRCIVTAAWATEEAMQASAASVRDSRSKAAEVLRADTVDVQEWEIAALHRVHPAGPDACARVIWTEADPSSLDGMVDAFRMSLLPRMEELPGFCSVSLMIDRMTGRASAAVTYESRDALMRSRQMGASMRDDFATAMGARITEVAEFDLALAHLRVPEMA
ncbi:antibiotic biosynthesis monooxygenase [Modestobacter altitudinis]|uniref:antibiotic biosynthesis monooxygenase n=1 Tax=Modestobacter altitudinis TaxID=2213158 RepID=UPI00110CB093|nr:antibiotic biosynthesis monooxygenase [Modestobacter altitudinis]